MTLDQASVIVQEAKANAHKGVDISKNKKLKKAFEVLDKEKGMHDKSKAGPLPGWAELNAEKDRYKKAIEEIWDLPIDKFHSTASRTIAFRAMNPEKPKKD